MDDYGYVRRQFLGKWWVAIPKTASANIRSDDDAIPNDRHEFKAGWLTLAQTKSRTARLFIAFV